MNIYTTGSFQLNLFRKKILIWVYFHIFFCLDISQPTKKLPVLVTIHGGAFKRGSGRFIGPDFLINEDPNLVVVN